MIKVLCLAAMFIGLCAASTQAAPKAPSRGFSGIELGMAEADVHSRLQQIATQQKEEREAEGEGEQEVWVLKAEPRFSYLVVRFNGEHRVALITVMARRASHIPYAAMGDVKDARQQTDGRNYTYTWQGKGPGATGYVVVARGSDPQYLTSYTIAQAIK